MKENQRSRLSKILLKNALISLLQEKSIQKISIKEICDTAELNRTTFYKYYCNEYELLQDLCNDALQMLLESIGKNKPFSIKKMLEIISSEKHIIKAIFNNNADENLPKRILAIPEIKEYIIADIDKNKSPVEVDIIVNFVCYGAYYIIKDWITNDCSISVSCLAEQIVYLSQKLCK